MSETTVLLCDCLESQSIDAEKLQQACRLKCSPVHSRLCMEQMETTVKAIEATGEDGELIIACGQEHDFFTELALDMQGHIPQFVDLRDRAGWSQDSHDKSPKMAALLADAILPVPEIKAIDIVSSGICLILGDNEQAFSTAEQLCQTLSVTLLVSPDTDTDHIIDRRFEIVKGKLVFATGSLGNFKVKIDALSERNPAGRGAPAFHAPQNGATSQCDIILDLRGNTATPLFPAHEKREGYLYADPKNTQSLMRVLLEASQLTGTFEQPLYVTLNETLCAHSRARKTGCSKCLDNCPTGALAPEGDYITVAPNICAGCGACSALCPTGAISYDAPPVSHNFERLNTMITAWNKLAKIPPRLLVHDGQQGAEMIKLSARYGRGLPYDVIPMEVTALAAFGHAEMLAACAMGFAQVYMLLSPKTERDVLLFEQQLANAIISTEAVYLIEPAHPDALDELLYEDKKATNLQHDVIVASGSRRQITRLAAKALHGQDSEAVIPLPEKAPYGQINVDTAACTLCLSCVSLCPAGALAENPDKPQLRFQEDACLQCGICANICPEKAISLEPRLNLSNNALSQTVLHEEEPFACIECGALFGVKSSIEKISEKLAGTHAMFANPKAAKMIQMCDNCRVSVAYHFEDNPFSMGARPKIRTGDDADDTIH